MNRFEVGQKVYNHGDMANLPHWATITKFVGGNYPQYELTPTNGDNPYWVMENAILETFKGHSGTRIVTEQAYKDYQNNR